MADAQKTEQKIDEELEKLRQTLANIEDARSFDELTVSSLVLSGYPMPNPVLDEGCCRRSSPYSRGCRDHDKERQMDSTRLVLNSYSLRHVF